MTTSVEGDLRARIAGFLPDAIGRALGSYHEFSGQDVPGDAKGFTAHHSACKVAIAHIELLIKLARWADLPDTQSETDSEARALAELVASAEAELARYQDLSDQD